MKTCFFNVFGLGCIMLAVILCGCMSWFHQGKQEMATRSMQEKIQAIVNIVGEYRKLTKEHVLQSSKVLLHTKIPQGGQRVDEIITIKNESGGETKLHYLFGTTLRDVSVYDIDKKHIYDIYLDDKDTHFTYMEYTKEYLSLIHI